MFAAFYKRCALRRKQSPSHICGNLPISSCFVDDQQDCLLLNQPLEILLLIAKACPPESAAALSVTCKSAYILLLGEAKSAIDTDRLSLENFLLLLEKDTAGRSVYCEGCTKLHSLPSALASTFRYPTLYEILSRRRQPRCFEPSRICPTGGIRLRFDYLHLLMRVHRLGLRREGARLLRGLEGHRLLHSQRLPWKPSWSVATTPRIIGDELCLLTRHEIWLEGTPRRNHLELRAYFGADLCAHVTTPMQRRLAPAGTAQLDKLLPELFDTDKPEHGGVCPQTYGTGSAWCRVCLTDFAATIEREQRWWGDGSPRQTLRITILSYRLFGRCLSPSDRVWRAAICRRPWLQTAPESREHLGDRYKPGAVSKLWKGQV